VSLTSNKDASKTALPEHLLRNVSRSFFLTLRVLPGSVRSQISLAYLVARAADTVADTEAIALEKRLAVLKHLRDRIQDRPVSPITVAEFIQSQAHPAERELLTRLEEMIRLVDTFTLDDQKRVRQVVDMITSGQMLDLERFGQCSSQKIGTLADDDELDDYTYRVAGCVGEFWTKMCRSHEFPKEDLDDASLLAQAILFGKGLQLINILRDLPQDLRRGRCYLPRKRLMQSGLGASDLLNPEARTRFQPLYHHYLNQAESFLEAGWDYTNRLPWRCLRVRLACSWPILIGLRTLSKLRRFAIPVSNAPVKISRAEVRLILVRSLISYPVPSAWRSLAQFHRKA
jgi:farnesyl-diphosphate farnesyltransferase